MNAAPFPYEGPEAFLQPIADALKKVIDPEVALNIVDVGLVYGVRVSGDKLHVEVTMTSAACPLIDVIMSDMEDRLDEVAPPDMLIELELVWEPPWTPERMSASAKRFMGW